jgi:hypothetical protein
MNGKKVKTSPNEPDVRKRDGGKKRREGRVRERNAYIIIIRFQIKSSGEFLTHRKKEGGTGENRLE